MWTNAGSIGFGRQEETPLASGRSLPAAPCRCLFNILPKGVARFTAVRSVNRAVSIYQTGTSRFCSTFKIHKKIVCVGSFSIVPHRRCCCFAPSSTWICRTYSLSVFLLHFVLTAYSFCSTSRLGVCFV